MTTAMVAGPASAGVDLVGLLHQVADKGWDSDAGRLAVAHLRRVCRGEASRWTYSVGWFSDEGLADVWEAVNRLLIKGQIEVAPSVVRRVVQRFLRWRGSRSADRGRHTEDPWSGADRKNATHHQARAAVEILEQLEGNAHGYRQVEPGWAATLVSVVDGDEKFRGNVWAGVAKAVADLDLWDVRRRFDAAEGEEFDPAVFILGSGTLYLLAKEDDPASRLLQCLVDDIARVGKSIADRSPNARLDPPRTVVLDEIANFALPALPTYVSGYGGSGMVTMVVIQGRSQMARTWGSDTAKAIWTLAPSRASSAA